MQGKGIVFFLASPLRLSTCGCCGSVCVYSGVAKIEFFEASI